MKTKIIRKAGVLLGSTPSDDANILHQENNVNILCQEYVSSTISLIASSLQWSFVLSTKVKVEGEKSDEYNGYFMALEGEVLSPCVISPSNMSCFVQDETFFYNSPVLEYISYFSIEKINKVCEGDVPMHVHKENFITLCSLKLASFVAQAAWSDTDFARSAEVNFQREKQEMMQILQTKTYILHSGKL